MENLRVANLWNSTYVYVKANSKNNKQAKCMFSAGKLDKKDK